MMQVHLIEGLEDELARLLQKARQSPGRSQGAHFPASGSAQASEPQRVGAMPLSPLRHRH